MKPLYMWAGGKNKMIKQYLVSPSIPTDGFDTFVEPFKKEFGSSSTFPQVVVDEKLLGGCTETIKYLQENNLV